MSSLLEIVEPTDASFTGDKTVVARRVGRSMIRRLKGDITKSGAGGGKVPAFKVREPVKAISVSALADAEKAIFKKVSSYCAKTTAAAQETDDAELVSFAMQIIKKRMLSSRIALANTVDMATEGFVPVYEGKHIEQFIYGIKPFRWWLRKSLALAKHEREPLDEEVLVYRETASNTNQRTCIAAILPCGSSASHKLCGIIPRNVDRSAALVVLNSFCFDYALRLRTAGTNISFTYMRPMPVPPATVTNALPRVSTICAWEHGVERITQLKEHWEGLWIANKAVAKAYSLSNEDFRHILASFPVFAKKHSEFFAFLTARLDSQAW